MGVAAPGVVAPGVAAAMVEVAVVTVGVATPTIAAERQRRRRRRRHAWGGWGRRSNGVRCPGCAVNDPLSSGYLCGRLPFRPLRLLHSALIENKALTPPERRLPRKLVGPARTL